MHNMEPMEPERINTIRIDKEHYAKVLEARKKLPWHNEEYVNMYFESNHKLVFIKRN